MSVGSTHIDIHILKEKKKRQISSDNFWLALICEIVLVIYLMFFCFCSHTIQSHTFSLSPSLTHSFFSCVSLNTHFSSTQKCVTGFNCCIFTDCVNNLQTKNGFINYYCVYHLMLISSLCICMQKLCEPTNQLSIGIDLCWPILAIGR